MKNLMKFIHKYLEWVLFVVSEFLFIISFFLTPVWIGFMTSVVGWIILIYCFRRWFGYGFWKVKNDIKFTKDTKMLLQENQPEIVLNIAMEMQKVKPSYATLFFLTTEVIVRSYGYITVVSRDDPNFKEEYQDLDDFVKAYSLS